MTTTAVTTTAVRDDRRPTGEVLVVLSGAMCAMFVGVLSGTVVTTGLPAVLAELGGTQADYTWIVTSSLLAMTASTPVWGKLADLYSKRVLIQMALALFVAGSVACGFAGTSGLLIAFRLVQGIAMGGLMVLTMTIVGAVVPPRERGRYSGYLGAVTATATVGGPLLGGLIVDGLGWRWCFFLPLPLAALASVLLHRTLHLPVLRRDARIDWVGTVLLPVAISAVLVWLSLGGRDFAWSSPFSIGLLAGGLVLLAVAIWGETRVREPVLPLRLFRDRTIALAVGAGLALGVPMYASTVYLTQYFQLARGASAAQAGLLTLPMILGLLASATAAGLLVSRWGRWKPVVLTGAVLLLGGLVLLGLLMGDLLVDTAPYPVLAVGMAAVGIGVGACQQNIVLAVQNQVGLRDLGSVSSTASFVRSLGGVVGVTALGAVLGASVTTTLATTGAGVGPADGRIPDPGALDPGTREVVAAAYAGSFALVFAVAIPAAVLVLVAVAFIRETPLRDTVDLPDAAPDPPGPADRPHPSARNTPTRPSG